MAEDGVADPARAVAQTWAPLAGGDAEGWRRAALAAGVIDNTQERPVVAPPEPRPPLVVPAVPVHGLEIRLQPSASVWDGGPAPNAWLQECPDPLTKEVWGSSLRVGRADASRLNLADGERLRLARGSSSVEASVRIVSGQAPGTATLLLGYGRSRVGPIADGIGCNGYLLRTKAAEFALAGLQITRGQGNEKTPETQHHYLLDDEDLKRQFPIVPPGGRPAQPDVGPEPSLLPARTRVAPAWGMVIDNTLCIGCNACVVACQAENNTPVIGPDEIVHERDMHWLRIDRYDTSEDDQDPQPGFQPVPCMHCEHAPCEPVCPVEASVHDEHGLNLQVYNRCIGTRFCQANCPYKVRRFNFLDYQDQAHLYPGLNALPVTAPRNPEVTVRARGVMEKCTYCLQRIRAAQAVWGSKPPVTACQAACPTRAIVFGDLADPGSQVAQLQADPRRYALLGHLDTRPRTTYLARVRNAPGFGPGDGSSAA
jgi:Fe-S-cluster-containing dehydrogenase component